MHLCCSRLLSTQAHLILINSTFLPQALATLASIVISGVISLVDYSEAIYLWRVHKFDFSVWMVAFIGTLFLGVEEGLGISVGISLLLVIFESAYPHTATLGRLPGTHQYRNVKQYPEAEWYDGILLVRVDAPIYFANTQHIQEKIRKYYQRAEDRAQARSVHDQDEIQRIKYIIWELNPVSHIDTSGLHTMQEMNSTFKKEMDVQLCLTNPNPRVMRRLVQSGLADEIGRDHIFVSLHNAVQYCLDNMDSVEMEKHASRVSLSKMGSGGDELQLLPLSASAGVLPTSPIAEVNNESSCTDDEEVGLNLND